MTGKLIILVSYEPVHTQVEFVQNVYHGKNHQNNSQDNLLIRPLIASGAAPGLFQVLGVCVWGGAQGVGM